MYKVILPENYVKPPFPGRDKYTAALRSGKYSQIAGRLCTSSGYCCLGVISEIQGRLIVENGFFVDGLGGSSGDLSHDNPLYSVLGDCGSFPFGVSVVKFGATTYHLIGCNDQLGLTFPEIADIIEAVWEHIDE